MFMYMYTYIYIHIYRAFGCIYIYRMQGLGDFLLKGQHHANSERSPKQVINMALI